MADDPTVQFSLRRTSECPTCGHHPQLGEIECSLCGTTLPPSDPLPLVGPQDSSAPTLVAPLPARAEGGTVDTPMPLHSPGIEEETSKAVPQAPPPPRPTPAQEGVENAARPAPLPSPRLVPVSPIPEPPAGSRAIPPSVSLPSTQPQSNPFAKWSGLAAGALALFIVSFFAAKMFSPSEGEKETVIPSPKTVVERHDDKIADSNVVVEKKGEPVASLPPVTPAPQPIGRVTTAEQLFPIRVFGAEPNDEARGIAAFRAQVKQGLPGIREAYTAQLPGNPYSLGVVVLELGVASDGQVASVVAHITGSVSLDLQQTIVDVTKSWRFPPSRGAQVKCFYPLLLSPEKIDAAAFASHLNEVWPGRYKVLAGAPVPIRSRASDSAEQVGTFGPGLFLTVVSSQDGWLGALSPKGKVGYVHQDAIVPRVETATAVDAKG